MIWYEGPTVVEALDDFTTDRTAVSRPFRMPVQGVYKFTENRDDRRIVAGSVLTGTISVGDEVIFFPSGKRSRVATIEAFNSTPPRSVAAGSSAGFRLQEQVYIARGEVLVRADEPRPQVTARLQG